MEIEALMQERYINVGHSTINHRVLHLAPKREADADKCKQRPESEILDHLKTLK